MNQSANKKNNPLTFLKEELSTFFKISPMKERTQNNSSDRASKSQRAEKPFLNLLRNQGQQKTKSVTEIKSAVKQRRGILPENNIKKDGTKNSLNRFRGAEMNPSDEITDRFVHIQHAQTIAATTDFQQSEHAGQREEKPSESLSLATKDSKKIDFRHQTRDYLWALKNFAIYLTFDPNTANSELLLRQDNREVTRDWSVCQHADSPERFLQCPQVLCREALLESEYWEVLWSGGVDIAVTYHNISRNGDPSSCLFGHNEHSWSLECANGSYTPCHNKRRFKSVSPEPFTNRVGVYVNWPAGSLSFFCVYQNNMVHLHTFESTFTEPLYPGFWVWAGNGTVTLCDVELEWEQTPT